MQFFVCLTKSFSTFCQTKLTFILNGIIMLFKKIRGLFSNDLSIDLGTANTLIYVKRQGIVLD